MYIVIAILVFGILIAVHELGHFLAAKACGVKVNEFAIGMGPAIFKKQGKETLYSLRLLPIGGYCAMEGEDDASEDPGAFSSKPRWKRFIILAAGSFMNFLVGFILVVIICLQLGTFAGTTITELADGFPLEGESGLMVGDTIKSIDGYQTYYSNDFSTFMNRAKGRAVDITLIRDGEKITLSKFPLVAKEYVDENGEARVRFGMSFNLLENTLGEKMKFACYTTVDFVRQVWLGLTDLVRGVVGIRDLSGPVGIVSVINDVGSASASSADAFLSVSYICAFIAVNLAVMNMLPIPALDGGRIFFLLLTWIIEKIARRRLNPKYEGYIHAAVLILLFGLMAFVMVNDVVRIVNG